MRRKPKRPKRRKAEPSPRSIQANEVVDARPESPFGFLRGTIAVRGDIVGPEHEAWRQLDSDRMASDDPSRDPSKWPVRVFRLGAEPRDDLLSSTTAAQRLEMVATLSRRAWELTGREIVRSPLPEWPAVVFALLDANARFIVVGAHALSVHGVPRATQDLDVWIDPSDDNAARVWTALATFGAPRLGTTG